jgi:hypothetical protein
MYIDGTGDNFYGLSANLIHQYQHLSEKILGKLQKYELTKLKSGYSCRKRTSIGFDRNLKYLSMDEIPI